MLNMQEIIEQPHSLEAEKWLLACVFFDPQNYFLTQVQTQHLYCSEHQIVHDAMGKCIDKYEKLDPALVITFIGSSLDHVWGIDYLYMITAANTVWDYRPYEEVVMTTRHKREMLKHIQKVKNTCLDPKKEVDDVTTAYLDFSNATGRSKCTGLIKNAFDRMCEDKIEPKVFQKTKYRDIDFVIKGYRQGSLVTIGARPSVGKSAFILNLMARLILPKVKCCLFSTEMMAMEVTDRFICMWAGITSEQLESQSDEVYDKVGSMFNKITEGYEINIYDHIPNFSFVVSSIRREASLWTKVFFIDYLQQISNKWNHGSLSQEVGEMTTRLKLLANELGICIVLAAQLNRQSEQRADKRPILSDLRDSGNIEQDSDIIMLLHDESKYDEYTDQDVLEVHVMKNRHWPTSVIHLKKELKCFRLLDGHIRQ